MIDSVALNTTVVIVGTDVVANVLVTVVECVVEKEATTIATDVVLVTDVEGAVTLEANVVSTNVE